MEFDYYASTHIGGILLLYTHNLYIEPFYEFHSKCRSGQSDGETEVEILMQSKVRIPLITVMYIVSVQFQPVIMITALSWQYDCHDTKFNK